MKRPQLRTVLLAITALGLLVWGAAVTIPNSFSDGDVISAGEMNANFAAVKTAVEQNASDIATNRAGAAQAIGGTASLSTSPTSVLQIDVVAPTAGFAIITGQGEVSLTHTNGTASWVDEIGVSDTADSSLPLVDQVDVIVPASAASGSYAEPFSVTRVFPVSAGTTTFYLNATTLSGTVSLGNIKMTAVFVPTTAGTVSTAALSTQAAGTND